MKFHSNHQIKLINLKLTSYPINRVKARINQAAMLPYRLELKIYIFHQITIAIISVSHSDNNTAIGTIL